MIHYFTANGCLVVILEYGSSIFREPQGRRLSFALGRICVLCYTGEQFVQSDIICMVESYVSCDVNSLVSRLWDPMSRGDHALIQLNGH